MQQQLTNLQKMMLLAIAMLYAVVNNAQQPGIQGRVLNAITQQAVAAAAIKNTKGTVITLTNAEGRFSINAISDSVFYVQHVNYESHTQQMATVKNGFAEIRLIPLEKELDEVVVSTGYQRVARERATGSFEKISNAAYRRVVSSDVLTRMEGLTTAMLFDKREGKNLLRDGLSIRGLSTINANQMPLIVLDNFPYEGDINNINPNDVESITLLKDAAAASIWGARAGNGVIVITTKKANYKQALRVGLVANYTIAEKPNLFYLPNMSTSDFIDHEMFLFDKGFYNTAINNTTSRPVVSPVTEILVKQRSGAITAAEATAQINALRDIDSRQQFMDYLYRPATRQQYALQLSTGTERSSYYLSAGYDDNKSEMRGNDYTRATLRWHHTTKVNKRFEVTTGAMLTQVKMKNNSPGGYTGITPGGGKVVYYPYLQLADATGTPLPLMKDYRGGYTDTAGAGRLLSWKYNPIDEMHANDKTTIANDILLKVGLRYEVNNSMNVQVNGQYQVANGEQRNHYSAATYFTRNLVNRYTQVSNTNVVRHVLPKGGILDMSNSRNESWDVRGQLNYHKRFAGNHEVTGLAGGEVKETHTESRTYRTYGYNKMLGTFVNADVADTYPIYGNLSGSAVIPNPGAMNDLMYRFTSLFANAAYSYQNRYTVSASARKDASNLFGVKTNQRGVPLWSAGAAWKISNERFYKVTALPYLNFRLTYGVSGNTDNRTSAYATIRYFNNAPLTNLNYASVANPSNPTLRWEQVKMMNVGVDFKTKNDLLTGSIEYYSKRSQDLLSTVPVDPTTGFQLLTINTAHLSGKGVDVNLTSNVEVGKLTWTANGLFSWNNNKVQRYLLTQTGSSYIGNGISISPLEGRDVYPLFSFRYMGLDTIGDPLGWYEGKASKDYNTITSQTNVNDLVYHGSAIPNVFGVFRNTLNYKWFALTASVAYRFNYFYRNSTIDYDRLYNQWLGHADYAKRWQQRGDELHTNVPAMPYPGNAARDMLYVYSEVTVEKADNIRLQDVSFSYNAGTALLRKLRMSALQLHVIAQNLGILWRANKSGVDPDYGSGLPATKQISIGINASF